MLAALAALCLTGCGSKNEPEEETKNGAAYFADVLQEQMEKNAEKRGEEERAKDHAGEDKVVKIKKAEDLLKFAERVNGGEQALGALLTADIDLAEVCGEGIGNWQPIKEYNGTFDGDGHTVSGLYIVGSDEYSGLFASITDDGVVKNLGMTDFMVDVNDYAGSVVGYSTGLLENCWSDGEIASGDKAVGGVAGYASHLTGCYNLGQVVSKDAWAGGVVGELDIRFMGEGNAPEAYASGCYNKGSVSGTGFYIGGVVGIMSDERSGEEGILLLEDCYNEGPVQAELYAGGVAGAMCGGTRLTMNRCVNKGEVSGDYYAGGLVGYTKDTRDANCLIVNSANKGTVRALPYKGERLVGRSSIFDHQLIGGLGGVTANARYVNCYNTGKIEMEMPDSYSFIGGLAGRSVGDKYSYFYNCYSNGELAGSDPENVYAVSAAGFIQCTDHVFFSEGLFKEQTKGLARLLEGMETSQEAFTDGTVLSELQGWPLNGDSEKQAELEGFEYELSGWIAGPDGNPCFDWEV